MLRRRIRALLVGALGLLVASCLEEPKYTCSDATVCVLNNVQGSCDLPTGTCFYNGPECMSGFRDAHGNCVIPTGSASASASASSTTASDDASTTEAESSSSGAPTDTAATTFSSSGVVGCEAGSIDITNEATVGASTVYRGYPAELAVDGDLSTSWFSTGPEATDTSFSWTLPVDRCILSVALDGNAMHDEAAFRMNYGFESVTIQVLDLQNDVVFEETRQLTSTPDPHVEVETDGVVGSRVVLVFSGHENEFSGGFAELQVIGQ